MLLLVLITIVLMTGLSIYQCNAYKTRTDTMGVNCFFAYFGSCFVCMIGLAITLFRIINGV